MLSLSLSMNVFLSVLQYLYVSYYILTLFAFN